MFCNTYKKGKLGGLNRTLFYNKGSDKNIIKTISIYFFRLK